MLVIDDNKLRLAKMQETLLKVTFDDKENHLKNYKKTVTEIDSEAFAEILEQLGYIEQHNHTLEDELQFLEKIKDSYEQLLELQLTFKKNYEMNGGDNLVLSDLSRLNIEYIEERINAINGYLINTKNIDSNKCRLAELNASLVEEEKKNDFLKAKLLKLEQDLRDNFLNAEGRMLSNGALEYTDVLLEYEKLGYDFRKLLSSFDKIKELLVSVENEKKECEEKLKTAEICYNSSPSSDSSQILKEISLEFVRVLYKLAMVKILDLLVKDYDDYDSFKEKREKLLDLVKYRRLSLEKLGAKISIDSFSRTKISEQLNMVSSLGKNSKTIYNLRKEISLLNLKTEEMVKQNGEYMISLSETKDLIQSRTSLNDIDISSVVLDEPVEFIPEVISVSDNQVISVNDYDSKFKIDRVREKTSGVIRRVCDMINDVSPVIDVKGSTANPELVIVEDFESVEKEQVDDSIFFNLSHDNLEVNPIFETRIDDSNVSHVEEETLDNVDTISGSIFEDVVPFEEVPMFTDRLEDSMKEEISIGSSIFTDELTNLSNKDESELQLEYTQEEDKMPDAFWVTQEDALESDDDDKILSFDEQIDRLLSSEGDSSVKSKRLVA